MIKKIVIPALFLIPLTGCASDPRDTQCDEDKNYVFTNPKAIEQFNNLQKEGKIKSYYSYHTDVSKCDYGNCMEFSDKFDYHERNMIFNGKESIYTIKRIYNLEDSSCIVENRFGYREKPYCFSVTENKKDEIKSSYTFTYDNTAIKKISFKNNKTGEILFERSYQFYTVKYPGAIGGGKCPPKRDNNPEYEFDIWSLIQ